MRRTLQILALLALILTWCPTPALPQGLQSTFILQASRTSVTANNSVTADTPLWTNTLPVGVAAAPLHLRLEGSITTGSGVTTAMLGCAYQSSSSVLTPNASVSIGNGATYTLPQAASSPLVIDFWVRPQPVWPANVNIGEAAYATVSIASQTNTVNLVGAGLAPTNGSSSGMLDMTSTTAANIICTWHWGTAATTNDVIITNGYVGYGQ